MNLETRVDKRIWEAIRSSVENRNYTGAIQDTMYFLSDLIRQKSGLEGDGTSLVGHAFGGRNPILKVNKLQTESEKNFQSGIEQLLRGLYQGIRNPRSHDKILDSEEDAIAIILFVNYLVKTIDQSKPPFLERDFITLVFDEDFVPNQRYAELLVGKIPPKKYLDIFYMVFHGLAEGKINGKKIKLFIDELLKVITEEEKYDVYKEISNTLQRTGEGSTIRAMIDAFHEIWPHLSETARLRIEHKLIKSIKEGFYDSKKGQCLDGALGTWSRNIAEHFLLKDELLYSLTAKLDSPKPGEQNYVFQYFPWTFFRLAPKLTSSQITVIKRGLAAGDIRFQQLLENYTPFANDTLLEPVRAALETFMEMPRPWELPDDEIPF